MGQGSLLQNFPGIYMSKEKLVIYQLEMAGLGFLCCYMCMVQTRVTIFLQQLSNRLEITWDSNKDYLKFRSGFALGCNVILHVHFVNLFLSCILLGRALFFKGIRLL